VRLVVRVRLERRGDHVPLAARCQREYDSHHGGAEERA
jgi:hypothetical protein